jgi:hypothetical protein
VAVEVAVPPFEMPRTPETSAVSEISGWLVSSPALAEERTKPEPRVVKVEEPVTKRPPAKVETPLTARVPEAFNAVETERLVPVALVKVARCSELTPVTTKVPEALMLVLAARLVPVALVKLIPCRVACPVAAKVPEALRLPAIETVPLAETKRRTLPEALSKSSRVPLSKEPEVSFPSLKRYCLEFSPVLERAKVVLAPPCSCRVDVVEVTPRPKREYVPDA